MEASAQLNGQTTGVVYKWNTYTTHDTIVDDDEIVNMWLNTSVGNIIHMARQIISAVALRDESPELDILPSYLLWANIIAKNLMQLLLGGRTVEGASGRAAYCLGYPL